MSEFSYSFSLTPRAASEPVVSGEAVPMETLIAAQNAMAAMPDAKTDFSDQTSHHFSRDVYGRNFKMSAGQTVISKIHKHSCFFVMLKGELLIAGNQGKRIIRAGEWFITEAGAKRCVHALSDVECMTFHGTKETDIDAVEAELIVPEEIDVNQFQPCDLLGVF